MIKPGTIKATMRLAAAAGLICGTLAAAGMAPGDARRGEKLFESEQCVACHSFQGKGGRGAPDLARRIDRNFTPALMASAMWNHAPAMWEGMTRAGIVQAKLSPEAASDLFAYFMSAHYFEKPGDAARGKQVFAARHCASCHGIVESKFAGAPPVAKWESLADPVVMAQQMWNHAGGMQKAFAEKKLQWSQLTAQELTDILVYLQNLPETRALAAGFSFSSTAGGDALFESKGCVKCHTGRMALENKLKNATMTEIAAAMWNHAPNMAKPAPALSQEEMRQVVSYIWAKQYFGQQGSAVRGKKVFAQQGCGGCHGAAGAPNLAKGKDAYSDITIISALWEHGPRMLARMKANKRTWPRFTAAQMSDVIAYLNSL
jgi:mono/diheme cytochrome c family protein